jgi:hypothetical protein
MKESSDVRVARTFRNVDHLTFIDGCRPHHTRSLLQDELNPQAGARDVFAWMLSDILDNTQDQGGIAGSKTNSSAGKSSDAQTPRAEKAAVQAEPKDTSLDPTIQVDESAPPIVQPATFSR